MDVEKVIDRVQKLLRLAKSDNVNEASQAAERAQYLIDKYKLDVINLGDEADRKEPVIDTVADRDFLDVSTVVWRRDLAYHLAHNNQVRIYYVRFRRKSQISMVGRKSDIQIVRYMYKYLVKEIRRLTRQAHNSNLEAYEYVHPDYDTSFKRGAVAAIGARLQAARDKVKKEAQLTQGSALMVLDQREVAVDDFMKGLNLKEADERRQSVLTHGFNDGVRAGNNINLGGNRELGAGAKRIRD